uniref:Uncharacterized protein n=2 Tax=viral metagenome TaxID=1070528 RepID=A0A6M3ITM8_9ZZZZ
MTKFFFCTKCHRVRSVYDWRLKQHTSEDEVCCAYREPDEDVARAEHEDRRKCADDAAWVARREERSGAYYE